MSRTPSGMPAPADCSKRELPEFSLPVGFTGFASGGAVVEDVELKRRTVGAQMGVKAAGGTRTLDDALVTMAAGASRIGTRAGVSILQKALQGAVA